MSKPCEDYRTDGECFCLDDHSAEVAQELAEAKAARLLRPVTVGEMIDILDKIRWILEDGFCKPDSYSTWQIQEVIGTLRGEEE